MSPPCTTTVVHECYPASCTTDANCPNGMNCYSDPSLISSERLCLPRYVLPCTTAFDCGEGFTCSHTQICDAPAIGANGTTTPGSCTTGSAGHCKVIETRCTSDLSCLSQWTCIQVTRGGSQSCTAGTRGFDGGVSTAPMCTSEPSTTEMLCAPPYYDQIANLLEHESNTSSAPIFGAPGKGTATGNGSSNDSGGCQVALGHTSSSGTAILGLLGSLGLLRRRRSRAA